MHHVVLKTEVSPLPLGHIMRKEFLLTVEFHEILGDTAYQVVNEHGQILSADGEWGARYGHEAREIDYRRNHTFTYEDALARADQAAMDLLSRQGITVPEVLKTVGMEYKQMCAYLDGIVQARR